MARRSIARPPRRSPPPARTRSARGETPSSCAPSRRRSPRREAFPRRARQDGEHERAGDDEKRGGDDRFDAGRAAEREDAVAFRAFLFRLGRLIRRRLDERVAAAEAAKRDGVRRTRRERRVRRRGRRSGAGLGLGEGIVMTVVYGRARRAVQGDARDGAGRGAGRDARKRELFPPAGRRHRAALAERVDEPRGLASGASGGDEHGDVRGERGVARDAFALGERPSGLPRAQGRARLVVHHRQRRLEGEKRRVARLRGVLHLERAPRGAVGRLARAPSPGRAARRAHPRVVRHGGAPGTAGLFDFCACVRLERNGCSLRRKRVWNFVQPFRGTFLELSRNYGEIASPRVPGWRAATPGRATSADMRRSECTGYSSKPLESRRFPVVSRIRPPGSCGGDLIAQVRLTNPASAHL